MVRGPLTWASPLYVTVPLLFVVLGAVSLALAGTMTPYAILRASVGAAAQWGRKGRQAETR